MSSNAPGPVVTRPRALHNRTEQLDLRVNRYIGYAVKQLSLKLGVWGSPTFYLFSQGQSYLIQYLIMFPFVYLILPFLYSSHFYLIYLLNMFDFLIHVRVIKNARTNWKEIYIKQNDSIGNTKWEKC